MKIFISYSHKDKNVVDEIENVFRQYNIQIYRDIRDVKYGDSFSEFMKNVRISDFVLMVISDHFLKSEYCMYEVAEFLKDSNYDERILPIVIETANIYSPLGILNYIKYWEVKFSELKKHCEDLSFENLNYAADQAKRYKNYSYIISNFLESLKDRNNKNYEQLKDENFIDLLNIVGIQDLEVKISKEDEINIVLNKTEKANFNEHRVIVLGNGGVGKTSLISRFTNDSFNQDILTTHGIDIQQLKINGNSIDFWDFGGQEIYHSTYEIFLSQKAIYILVIDSRSDNSDLDYWLKTIQHFRNNEFPFYIAINKSDERTRQIDIKSIDQNFENFGGVFHTSAKNNIGIKELKNAVIEIVSNKNAIEIPFVWLNIISELESLNKPYLTIDEWVSISQKHGMELNHSMLLSNFLHDLGKILHFQDNPKLRQYIFLKPLWITNAFYKIFDNHEVIQEFGIVSISKLKKIWNRYSINIQDALLELILEFQLSYIHKQSKKLIIPELLPPSMPEISWNYESSIRLRYQYNSMPNSLIFRFQARMNYLINTGLLWKKGCLINNEDSKAFILSSPNKIDIYVQGIDKLNLIAQLRVEFNELHKFYRDLEVIEEIPCNCNICTKNKEPIFYQYSVLAKYLANNKKYITCPRSIEDVNINNVLSGEIGTQRLEGSQIISLIDKISDDKDTEETLIEKINKMIELKPNFFGIGINLNEIINLYLNRRKPSS